MAKKSGLGTGLDTLFEDNGFGLAQENGTVLRLTEIEPNRNQPRKEFDEQALSELADSIREHGIIQPLLVRPLETGGYQLVAGERRWRAARMIGLTEVPVVIKEMTETEVMELALIENLQRQDLNPLEEAAGYRELMTTYGLTQDQVAKRVGKSRSAVANCLRLLTVPEEIQPFLRSGQLSAGHVKALAGMSDREEMVRIAKSAADKGLSVREVERQVQSFTAPRPSSPSGEEKEAFYKELELAMNVELGRKVRIRPGRIGGTVEIAFFDQEDLRSLAYRLSGEESGH